MRREEAFYALRHRRFAAAFEGAFSQRAEGRGGRPFHQLLRLRKAGENIIGTCTDRLIPDGFAGGGDEAGIKLDRGEHAIRQCPCVLVKCLPGCPSSVAGIKRREHLMRLHGQEIPVQCAHAAKHSIELQRIERAGHILFVLQLFLQLHDHAWQQKGVERALIGIALPPGDLVFLIEAETDIPHALPCKAGVDIAQIVECWKNAQEIGVGDIAHGNTLNQLLIGAEFAVGFCQRLRIGEIGENPAREDDGNRDGARRIGNAPDKQLPPRKAFVAHYQRGFREDDVLEEPRKEIAPASPRRADGTFRFRLCSRSEVDTTQKRRFDQRGTCAKFGQSLVKPVFQPRQFRREPEDASAYLRILFLLQAFDQHRIDPLLQQFELFRQPLRQVLGGIALIQLEGRAPDLLAIGLVETVEEFHEAMQEVCLRQHDIDRHAGVQIFIQFGKPLTNGAQLLPLLLGITGEKIGDGQGHQSAVDRLRTAISSQKAEETFPARFR